MSRVLSFGFRFMGSGPQAVYRKQKRSTEDNEESIRTILLWAIICPLLKKRRAKRMTMTLAISAVGTTTDPQSASMQTPAILILIEVLPSNGRIRHKGKLG